MDLREALGRSTMHALPRAIKSRSMHGRAFWCSVFLVANLILGYHVFRLLNRYLQHNVTTTIRTKLNDTLLLPVVYMMLFNTEKIVTDMPYKVVREGQPYDTVFEFSNWSSVEMGTTYDEDVVQASIKFCGRGNQDIFGYFMIMEPKAAMWSFLEEGYPIKNHQTLVLVQPLHKQTLPPPYSKCSNDYPSFIWMNENFTNHDYSQVLCQHHCRLSYAAAKYCGCSMRSLGFETNVSQSLPDCTDDPKPINSNITFPCEYLTKNLSEIMFSRKSFFQHLKIPEINAQCRKCPQECDSTSYPPSIYYELLYNDQLNCTKDYANDNFFSEAELKIKITQEIQEIIEDIDYPLLEFSSEFIGILGTYLGVSFCTFAELFGFFYILCERCKQEKLEQYYDFAAENGDPDPRAAASSQKSKKSSIKSTNGQINRNFANVSLVKQRSFDDVA